MYTPLDTTRRSGPQSLGNETYLELKTQLLRGDYQLHCRLSETRLAAAIGVSRTPVREALKRLASESLVEPRADGGFQPRVPDTTTMRHLYEIRAGLELQALRRPTLTAIIHDRKILEPLLATWQAMGTSPQPDPTPDFVLVDEHFHVTLALAAGNGLLADLLGQINERIRIIRMHDFLLPERIAATIREHTEIVELVLAGDLGAAELAFNEHLATSLATVEEQSSAALLRMARKSH